MKYYINPKVFNAYGATPKLCVLDAVYFLEFNSKKSERANFICFASNEAIIQLALKKAEAYSLPLTYIQAKNCLKNCKQSGELVKALNYETLDDIPLCPLTDKKYVWMTTLRADMTQDDINKLKNKKTRAPFEVRRPELVSYRERFMQVLRNRNIHVAGKEHAVEAQIEKVLEMANAPSAAESPFFNGYIDFLEDEGYQYQLENNKYTPRLTRINDISEKVFKIREFARNKDSWYNPNKHLKEKF